MSAQVVITRPTGNTPAIGGLFDGLSFFLVQRLPSRSGFIEKIQSNGGRVVRLEKQADHLIADHLRHECPPGSISYSFIDAAIRNGALPDAQDHLIKPKITAPREAGSGAPGKSTRTAFTAEDDRVLWNWVARSGGRVKGNEIYKQLEAENSRHTWQAWRDRYVKRLMDKPPAGVEVVVPANPPPSPPTAQDEQPEIQGQMDGGNEGAEVQQVDEAEERFTEQEVENLLEQGGDIEAIAEDQWDDAWNAWAEAYPQHSAGAWRRFWVESVRPEYLSQKMEAKEAAEGEWRRSVPDARRQGQKNATEQAEEAEQVDELTQNEGLKAMDAQSEVDAADVGSPDELAPSADKEETAAKVPPSSQKRKRLVVPSSAERVYGKKKRKSGNDEVFGQAGSNSESASEPEIVEQALPTSELDRQARAQLIQESQEAAEGALPVHATIEDVQVEAQALFDEEVFGISRGQAHLPGHPPSYFLTSEIYRAADEQVRRESLERDAEDNEEFDEESSELKTPSVQSEDSDNDDESIRSQEGRSPPGDRLTEANLASQQAQHKTQVRGVDLPEDIDIQDGDQQDEFVRYLQGITGRSSGAQAMPTTTYESQASAAFETQLPPNDVLPPYGAFGPNSMGELPLSQEEIDGMIRWPESPVFAYRTDHSPAQSHRQSQQPQTQAPYPQLPAAESHLSGQPSMVPGISYPSLPGQRQSPIPRARTFGSQPSPAANGSNYVTSDESVSSHHDQDEVDLFVPPPMGGWSSSPEQDRSSQATPIARRQQELQRMDDLQRRSQADARQVSQRLDDRQQRSQADASQEVLEIPSTSSSSSSSSSDEEEPAAPQPAIRKQVLETQDILDAETQQPDFDMPLPPDSDDGFRELSSDPPDSSPVPPNAAESQRRLAETQQLEDSSIDEYITRMTIRGYKEPSIIAALKCTSMRPELVELVLLDEKAGNGLPNDVAGIWSEAEDKMVEGSSAKAIRKLTEKHGEAEVDHRWEFLRDYREEEDW